MSATPSAAETKSCCAAAYGSDAVALVLGDSYHPGGMRLTRHLGEVTGLRPGQRVLDVASGPGSSALMLAGEYGVSVDGVDLGESSLARAEQAARDAGLADRVRFRLGDAERLPFPDATFDAVVCECAFCTFPDKDTAAREITRVLVPGGRLGLTDVTLAPGGLPPSLQGLAGWVACLADARPLDGYADVLSAAGLEAVVRERHDDALAAMVDQVEARLRTLALLGRGAPSLEGVDLDRALDLTRQARRAVQDGVAGYALLVAVREESP